MSAKVWAGTKSNPLFVHAFPEAKGLCNGNIRPGGDLMTLDEAKRIQLKVCERCEFRMRHLARKAEAERNPVQALTPEAAAKLAETGDKGRVLFEGSAKEYKRPQGYPTPVRVEAQGAYWALIGEDGNTVKRVRADHPLYVRRCPEGYDDMRARAEAEAEAEAVALVEVTAPVAQAEKASGPASKADEDVTLTAQDIADAELGACEWDAQGDAQDATEGARYRVGQEATFEPADGRQTLIRAGRVVVMRVVDHGPDAVYHAGGRFTYVVGILGVPSASQGVSESELSPVEDSNDAVGLAYVASYGEHWKAQDAQAERAEAREIEAAARRLEALRAPEVTADVPFEGTHKNIQHMISFAPNDKARASWNRVATASWYARRVMAHAKANYSNGWDVVVETCDASEMNVMMLEALRGGVKTPEDAISFVRSRMVDTYREAQADALISAWGAAIETASDHTADEVIKVTDAMVREIEKATVFEHGTEIGGHAAMLGAMERQGLIRRHGAGGTLTDRGMWLRGYLMAGGTGREFRAAEMQD